MEQDHFQSTKDKVKFIIEKITKYPSSGMPMQPEATNKEYRLNTILLGAEWANSIIAETEFDLELLRISCKGVDSEHYKELCCEVASTSLRLMKSVLDEYLTDRPSVLRMPNSITLITDLRYLINATYKLEGIYLDNQSKELIIEIKKKIFKLVNLHDLDF